MLWKESGPLVLNFAQLFGPKCTFTNSHFSVKQAGTILTK